MQNCSKSLVLGLGISGKAAARFLLAHGQEVWGTDRNREMLAKDPAILDMKKQNFHPQHEEEPLDLSQFHQIIVSPGFPPDHPLCKKAKLLNIEMIGEVELACRNLKQDMIGITGTNGKTTVTLLITHVLNKSGIPARALGNVGVPISEELLNGSNKEVIVAELSSFQLDTMKTPALSAGVVLNITPDHLDRYGTMENYALSKLYITKLLKANAPFYVYEDIVKEFPVLTKPLNFSTYGYEFASTLRTDMKYIYKNDENLGLLPYFLRKSQNHDLENILAAFAMVEKYGITVQKFFEAQATFVKPHHRIEYVRRLSGVDYYDDSKGTNIDAVVRAVEFLDGPIVLIAGGVDKGAPYTPWINAFKGKVKAIVAIGQAAPKMESQLSRAFSFKRCDTLEDAVKEASSAAVKGDKVLLSPGCSSYDMFRDYAHRGQEFQRLVNQMSVSGVTK